jgi:hypothetical protein
MAEHKHSQPSYGAQLLFRLPTNAATPTRIGRAGVRAAVEGHLPSASVAGS